MTTYYKLKTNGDPLGTVRNFIQSIWERAHLDGMLLPKNGSEKPAYPQLLTDAEDLAAINPFTPVMALNSARLVPKMLTEQPENRFGALLRPCELRALTEVKKRTDNPMENLVTISADCLGTIPMDEFKWRAKRNIAGEKLNRETLKFAKQGGIVQYRNRPACQVCVSPGASEADLNLHVLGLPVRQYLLVSNGNGSAGTYDLEALTNGLADQTAIALHERTLGKLIERHRSTYERVITDIAGILPHDLDSLVEMLETCDSYDDWKTVCPLCAVDEPKRTEDGHLNKEDVARWVLSCAGCGMCEQAATGYQPLSLIFTQIREKIADPYEYLG